MDNIIKIRGARQNNLKNIDLDIPKNKLVIFTGVSGSGKSSLAFDTIYAEGQRRYVESLSSYARQFLGVMEKPDIDLIEGLSPAISIDQKTTSHNPRSTVGTITEIYDYLRLLFARIGHPHCPICGREISLQSLDQICIKVDNLIQNSVKTKRKGFFFILSPLTQGKKGEFSSLFDNLKAKGFKYVRIDGVVKDLEEDFLLIKTNKHNIEVVVDRLSLSLANVKDDTFLKNLHARLSESIESALKLSDGSVIVAEILDPSFELPTFPKKFSDNLFSENFACPVDNLQIQEIEPRTFSFNSPYGACPECNGLGKILSVIPETIFSEEISISEGGVLPFSNSFAFDTWLSRLIVKVCKKNGIDTRVPIKQLKKESLELLLNGTADIVYKVVGTNRYGNKTHIFERFSGIVDEINTRYKQVTSEYAKTELEKFMRQSICPVCNGARLKKESLAVTIQQVSIAEVCQKPITKVGDWLSLILKDKSLSPREIEIGTTIIKELLTRLNFLLSVGLDYLTLDRNANSLAGGEAQRIRLASQIGSGLSGVIYILDEPTIGLHPRDNQKLILTLKKLKNLGNSIIVVEHDREMMEESDLIYDFGPGAGKFGGSLVAQGTIDEIKSHATSITGKFLSGKRKIILPSRQKYLKGEIKITGCNQYNLKNINVSFPLGKFIVVTGVSGSGKSTLIVDTLYHALASQIYPNHQEVAGAFKTIAGVNLVKRVALIDQSPIGKTPRSNPATYTKVFDLVRDVFAQTRQARSLGFKKGRFSFNLKGGRCESCEGQGQVKIEMQFMPDIWIDCEVCLGKRYNAATLDVLFKNKNIAEVLNLTVHEAKEFFQSFPPILRKLETLEEVGLGYIQLGQPATTLSGGEAQRVKLSEELSKKSHGETVYILDEPTTGLHFADLEKLINVLHNLVIKGNTVITIEHNLDVIRNADWIIDLGPEGGETGGYIVASGSPNDISENKKSYTGVFLQGLLK